MKQLALLSLLFAIYSSPSMAANAVGDGCPVDGSVAASEKGEMLHCKDGNWRHSTTTAQISFGVKLLENGVKPLSDTRIGSVDGGEATIKESWTTGGYQMFLQPIMDESGRIIVTVAFKLVDHATVFETKQQIAFKDGHEVILPFGPVRASSSQPGIPAPTVPKYTLKLIVTKS